ncbi:MAG: GAF domain-containing protein [Cytophagales bacterium]|nr:GAF domain-containing protein [Cytophagales bacterium]
MSKIEPKNRMFLSFISIPMLSLLCALIYTLSKAIDTYHNLINNNNTYNEYIVFSIIILILMMVILCTAYYYTNKISNKLSEVQKRIDELADGKLSFSHYEYNDEIGNIMNTISKLIIGLEAKAAFAEKIGRGELNTHYELLSQDDLLGKALINMRNNLEEVASEDKKRTWATEGLAQFGDVLRTTHNIKTLCNTIISQLVKYLKANQGAIFIADKHDNKNTIIQLMAAYAYDRQKYLDKDIQPGEGLIGQCYLEKDVIYMTDIPQNYTYITSGLGHATPASLVIVPMLYNDEVEGVIEMASFTPFQTHEIQFIQKIADGIASVVNTAKVNEKTKMLLESSQQQSEEMRAQEEEMRQNMEELMATQEEMERKTKENESKNILLDTLINNIPLPIFVKDHTGKYILINEAQSKLLYRKKEDILGKDDSYFVSEQEFIDIKKADRLIIEQNVPVYLPEQKLTFGAATKVLKTSKIPFTDKVTGQKCILGVSIDLTDYKNMENMLKDRIHELESRVLIE